ncbi:unnamed protein product [Rotaria sp. Silwood2]|nr:unnamed protein product [Rotaria sp. Silwood2]CAF4064838.1 unnamed protein product [Rotaria sp. Silwood2]CAF4450912.1 unnamed protein product [Rotaria sp. Silwood2]CAF4525594.1 unnamed protein product [Rotaria sp. Silwood2]
MQSGDKSRFTDLYNEPVDHLLSPIKGYQDKPLVSLPEAIEPVAGFFNGIEDDVFVALHNCQNPADGLDQQESASIHLYTMQFSGGPSLYLLLNKSLRAENREELRPWFSFLKLFLTALHKLPSRSGIVWRGVRDVDLSSKYKKGTTFAWWGVSSCTVDIGLLESEQFLGKHATRTLFSIEYIHGKSIAAHSYFKNTEQEIILMPGSYFEVIGQLNPAPELHIIQLREITPPIALVKPPFSKVDEQKSSSVVPKSGTLSPSISTMGTPTKTAINVSVNMPTMTSGNTGFQNLYQPPSFYAPPQGGYRSQQQYQNSYGQNPLQQEPYQNLYGLNLQQHQPYQNRNGENLSQQQQPYQNLYGSNPQQHQPYQNLYGSNPQQHQPYQNLYGSNPQQHQPYQNRNGQNSSQQQLYQNSDGPTPQQCQGGYGGYASYNQSLQQYQDPYAYQLPG